MEIKLPSPLNKGEYCQNETELLSLMMTGTYERGFKFTLPLSCALLACIEETSNFNPRFNESEDDYDSILPRRLLGWTSYGRSFRWGRDCCGGDIYHKAGDMSTWTKYIARELSGYYEGMIEDKFEGIDNTGSHTYIVDTSMCDRSSLYECLKNVECKFQEDLTKEYTRLLVEGYHRDSYRDSEFSTTSIRGYFDDLYDRFSRRSDSELVTRLENRAVEYYSHYNIVPLYNYNKYKNNELIVFAFFMKNKFTLSQTCAFLSNIYHECGFNPDAVNDSEGAYGICQWRGNRFSDLLRRSKVLFNESLLSESNTPRITLLKQLGFIVVELTTTEIKAYNAIKAYTVDRKDVAATLGGVVAKEYEECDPNNYEDRRKTAGEFYDHYKEVDYRLIAYTDLLDKMESEYSDIGIVSSTNPAYISLSGTNPYTSILESNLSSMEAEGYKYGYLIDNNTGDEFKFYVPEFSESAGANWNVVDIPGRSVDIHSYSKTNSRKITVSLELYAGEGLYKATSSGDDVVSKMHRDLNFVKSLEYPDYTNVIIKPPSTVHLILGSAVNMIGIVSDVQVEHLKPLDSQNRSMYTKLSFTVTQISADPPGYKEIRGASVGMTSTKDVSSLVGV